VEEEPSKDEEAKGEQEEEHSQDQSNKTSSEKIVFPWRHDEAPLPRLVEGTIDQATKGHLLSTVTTNTGNVQMNALASAFMFLDVPLYQFIFFGSWKGDLVDSMSWAFTQGVAGLLSKLTSPPGEFCSSQSVTRTNNNQLFRICKLTPLYRKSSNEYYSQCNL
jgi:hypothetical protein